MEVMDTATVDQLCLVQTWHELEIFGFAFPVEFCILWQAGTGCGGIFRGITCNYLIRDQGEAATGKCQSLVPGSGIHQSQAQGQGPVPFGGHFQGNQSLKSRLRICRLLPLLDLNMAMKAMKKLQNNKRNFRELDTKVIQSLLI